jgi:hypothetical protein
MTKRTTTANVGFPVKMASSRKMVLKKEPILPKSTVTQNVDLLRGWE